MSGPRPVSALPFALLAGLVALAAACAEGKGIAADGGTDAPPVTVVDGAPIVPDADTCAADPCSLLEQCGCDITTVCDVDFEAGDGSTICREVVSPGGVESNCTGATGCGAGFTCVAPGHCRRFCDDAEDCGEGAECFYQLTDGDDQPIPEARLCTKACSPDAATDNGCPADPQLACRILFLDPDGVDESGDEHFQSDCGAVGAGGNGAACTSGNGACRAGFGCFSVTSGGSTTQQCKQICEWEVDGVAGTRTCATGACQALADPGAVIGTVEYGACL